MTCDRCLTNWKYQWVRSVKVTHEAEAWKDGCCFLNLRKFRYHGNCFTWYLLNKQMDIVYSKPQHVWLLKSHIFTNNVYFYNKTIGLTTAVCRSIDVWQQCVITGGLRIH